MTTTRTILLVEDNEDDIFMMKRVLKGVGVVNPLQVVEDGQEAVDYLSGTGRFANRDEFPLPAVVFLDLKLPILMGLEVLAWIRSRPDLNDLVVVVLTSSQEPSDIQRAYRIGANSYVVKPPTTDQLMGLAKAFKLYWLEYNLSSGG